MKTKKIKAADVKLFSLFNSRGNLTTFKIAGFFLLFLRSQLHWSDFNLKHGGLSSRGREGMRSPAKQRLHGTKHGYNNSLQNK